MSIHTKRLESMLISEISNILMTEAKDEDLKFVTITSMNLANDLSYAKVYFTTLNEDKEKITKELNDASGFIRAILKKRKLDIRIMPELKFIYDNSMEYGNNIDSLIDKIKKED
ncbi:MAG: 30S ribosome-binding factor RbfA [Bacilli bacterium]|nr:30S ribosome-binding factor RbfA [Bacilli bacterium]